MMFDDKIKNRAKEMKEGNGKRELKQSGNNCCLSDHCGLKNRRLKKMNTEFRVTMSSEHFLNIN